MITPTCVAIPLLFPFWTATERWIYGGGISLIAFLIIVILLWLGFKG